MTPISSTSCRPAARAWSIRARATRAAAAERGPADFAENYHSWRGGILGPAHLLRQSAMFRRGNASRKVRGLYYAGGTVSPGVGVPMCLISAELVIKHLRGDRSTGPLPEPLLTETRENSL